MAGRSPKAKGARYELEVAKYLSERLDLPVARSCLTQQVFDKSQGNSDLIGLPSLAPECKRVESLNIRSALRQATANAKGAEFPVVITRRNREETGRSMVVLHLDDFIPLYRAWLSQEGYR